MAKKCKTCLYYNNNRWSCEEKNIRPLNFIDVHFCTSCEMYQNKYKIYIMVILVAIVISLIVSSIKLS